MPFAKKLGLAGMGTSLVAAGALLVGGPAGATSLTANTPATANEEGEDVTIPANSSNSAFVACPAGTVVTGGGGRTSGNRTFLTDSYRDGNGWRVYGTYSLTTGTSTIRAIAVCEGTS